MKSWNYTVAVVLICTLVAGCDKDNKEKPVEPVDPEVPKDTVVTYNFEFPQYESQTDVLAFPGAEGGGMYTTGGRGGTVYHVTTLEDGNTKGTLRYAVSQSGPRTVVFDVDGVIALNSALKITQPDLTIAGQTAPGDGICLKNYAMIIQADNIIIRYMRFRMGDEKKNEDDAFWGRYHKNIIIDHCSMSWSTDECASFYANSNFTMQWCIIAESLRNAVHVKGSHGYGGIWGGVNASFHHNLLAHHDSRNPRFDAGNVYVGYPGMDGDSGLPNENRSVDYRNCVVYNFCNFPAYGGEGIRLNFVGNYYKWGPASVNGTGISYDSKGKEVAGRTYKRKWFYYVTDIYQEVQMDCPEVFLDNNSNYFDSSVAGDSATAQELSGNNSAGFVYATNSSRGTSALVWRDKVLPISYGTTACKVSNHTAPQAFEQVLNYAGASLKRDAVDSRIAREVKDGTATYKGSRGSLNGLIDSQSDVGGWPTYKTGSAPADSDSDGIPDSWEDSYKLDKNNTQDGKAITLDPQKRYTNLEVYLHYLVKDITLNQNSNAKYISLQ